MADSLTQRVRFSLERIDAGDDTAREELINCAAERLRRLTRKMLRDYPRLKRWEETDDVFVNAMLRLNQALAATTPTSVRHFFRLASLQIRRELIDLVRHYYGPRGLGARHATEALRQDTQGQTPQHEPEATTHDPGDIAAWGEFHEHVEQLPDNDREVFELLWYHEVTQVEAAELLQVNRRTVIRRWQSACLQLHEQMKGHLPGI